MDSRTIRILLVDGSNPFLDSFTNWLDGRPDVIVVGTAATGRDAIEAAGLLRPDLVVMDVVLPILDGFRAAQAIKARPDPPCVLLVTLHPSRTAEDAAIAAGADGLLSKADLAETFDGTLVNLGLLRLEREPCPIRRAAEDEVPL